jgi:hypothetical protein
MCKERVLSRPGHRTLPATRDSLPIVDRFFSSFQRPTINEGFGAVLTVKDSTDPRIGHLVQGFVV